MGDPETKRKRYCLMCNLFKPDRCHHCSACNRCVLNMDHHCPWVNNCIGFWNRKYFLLLLFYVLCTLYYYILTMGYPFVQTIYWHIDAYKKNYDVAVMECIVVGLLEVSYLFALFLAFAITRFTNFHMILVRKNMTTIESLEHKGTNYDSMVLLRTSASTMRECPTTGTRSSGETLGCGLCPFSASPANPKATASLGR